MCDYSLEHVKSRPAKVGDKLTTRDFGRVTRGFAARIFRFDGPWSPEPHTLGSYRRDVSAHKRLHYIIALKLPAGERSRRTIPNGRGSTLTSIKKANRVLKSQLLKPQ